MELFLRVPEEAPAGEGVEHIRDMDGDHSSSQERNAAQLSADREDPEGPL